MEHLTIRDLIAILRRRWFLMAIPLAIGAPIAVYVAQSLPSVYESSARILVESQLIPDELAQSTVDRSVSERIALIRQRLMTRDNLLEIADELNVYDDGMSPTAVVDNMRRNSRIAGGASGARGNRSVTALRISFQDQDPQMAALVANEFVSRVIAQNVQQRTSQALGTLEFFTGQVDRLAREIDTMSRNITRFKIENRDALPDSLSVRQQELVQLRERRFARDVEKAELRSDLARLERQISLGLGPMQARTPQERELNELRISLAQQRAVKAESHPTVQRLLARINVLESIVQPQILALEGDADPVARIEQRADAVRARMDAIERQQEADEERIEDLQASIDRTPEVELALRGLQREFESLQTRYRDALLKRAQAETGEQLESSQQAERFEVIEQALAPNAPIAPDRRRIIAAGVVGSGAIGFGLMVLAELLNRSLRTAKDVETRLRLQPIAVIPLIRTERQARLRRSAIWIGALVLVVCGTAALYAVDRWVLPVSFLVERVVERTGIDAFLARFGG